MIQNPASISRPALVRLLLAASLLLGIAVAFTVFAGNASPGGDTKITVNSTANIDDGKCEGAAQACQSAPACSSAPACPERVEW